MRIAPSRPPVSKKIITTPATTKAICTTDSRQRGRRFICGIRSHTAI
jgi:hypothetical protein